MSLDVTPPPCNYIINEKKNDRASQKKDSEDLKKPQGESSQDFCMSSMLRDLFDGNEAGQT